MPFGSCASEHPLEDRIDVLEVIAEVEQRLDLGFAQVRAHLRVGFRSARKSPSPRQTCMALRCTRA